MSSSATLPHAAKTTKAPKAPKAPRPPKVVKARDASECQALIQLPNIGPAMVADFALLGILAPAQLREQDGFALYQRLCRLTEQRHDPCVLDTFIAAVDFMQGAPARPWWYYTPQRKIDHPDV